MTNRISIFLIGKTVPEAQAVEAALHRFSPIEVGVFRYADSLPVLLEMERTPPDIAVIDVNVTGFSAFKLIAYLKEQHPNAEILVAGDPNRDREKLKQALDLGANDGLFSPAFDRLSLEARLGNAFEKILLKRKLHAPQASSDIAAHRLGETGDLGRLFARLKAMVPFSGSVMIVGEAGVGKKTIAKAIETLSPSPRERFIYSYLPHRSKVELKEDWAILSQGEHADRVFYFDGLEDLELGRQQHLYGLMKEWAASVRRTPLMFGCKPGLISQVSEGRFHPDLFYLLSDHLVVVPPLRHRRRDLPFLMDSLSRIWSTHLPSVLSVLSREALSFLCDYHWPGNVRQLRQVVEYCLSSYSASGQPIDIEDLPPELVASSAYVLRENEEKDLLLPYREAKERNLAKFHENYIIYLLKRAKGNISAAALEAALDRSNFKKIMQKYHIKPQNFR